MLKCGTCVSDSYNEAREKLASATVDTEFSASGDDAAPKQYGRGHRISRPPQVFSPSHSGQCSSSSDEESAAQMLSTGLNGITPPVFHPPSMLS
jgi:hypothetical protein